MVELASNPLRLGINIDHIATIRNARGGVHPCPVRGAIAAQKAGADGITAHLREDRRHIRDSDIFRLKNEVPLPLNMEMAATEEMLKIALEVMPNACCLVPEKRSELTTEGGLDILGNLPYLKRYTDKLKSAGIRVSFFIDPEKDQVIAASEVGADIVELHTGTYCDAVSPDEQEYQLQRLISSVNHVVEQGIECHAGHGLSYANVGPIAAMKDISELNIGHFLMGESMFVGIESAIRHMRDLMDAARQ